MRCRDRRRGARPRSGGDTIRTSKAMTALTTDEIRAYRCLDRPADRRWVDWAVRLLGEGQDSPGLRILAGESEPFESRFFEMRQLVDRVFHELGILPIQERVTAAVTICAIRIRQWQRGRTDARSTLEEVLELHRELHEPAELQGLALLGWAYRDLENGLQQLYVPRVTRENFDAVMAEECERWLAARGTP